MPFKKKTDTRYREMLIRVWGREPFIMGRDVQVLAEQL